MGKRIALQIAGWYALNAVPVGGSIRSIDTLYSKYISFFGSFNIFGIHKQQA